MIYTITKNNFNEVKNYIRKENELNDQTKITFKQKAYNLFHAIVSNRANNNFHEKNNISFILFSSLINKNLNSKTISEFIISEFNALHKNSKSKENSKIKFEIFNEILLQDFKIDHKPNPDIFLDDAKLSDQFKQSFSSKPFKYIVKDYSLAAIYSYFVKDTDFSNDFYAQLIPKLKNNNYYFENSNKYSLELNSYIAILHSLFKNFKESNDVIAKIENIIAESNQQINNLSKITLGLAYLTISGVKWIN